jgi:hypothetical protein
VVEPLPVTLKQPPPEPLQSAPQTPQRLIFLRILKEDITQLKTAIERIQQTRLRLDNEEKQAITMLQAYQQILQAHDEGEVNE